MKVAPGHSQLAPHRPGAAEVDTSHMTRYARLSTFFWQ
jgi:hypothetical protein